MAKAKSRSPTKKVELSPRQLARIRELGRAGMGWRPWRLARRYGVTEAKIVEIIGSKAAAGRTGVPKKRKPKQFKTAAEVRAHLKMKAPKTKRPKPSVHPALKAGAPASTTLEDIFGKKKPEAEIPVAPAQVAN